MRSTTYISCIVHVSITAATLVGCQKQLLEEIPAAYTLPSNTEVYVKNDGRCDCGEVIKVTAGDSSLGIPRKYECVKHEAAECKILDRVPASYTIPSGYIVYVENDGRCTAGKILRITGGNSEQGIPRKYECVDRPR